MRQHFLGSKAHQTQHPSCRYLFFLTGLRKFTPSCSNPKNNITPLKTQQNVCPYNVEQKKLLRSFNIMFIITKLKSKLIINP